MFFMYLKNIYTYYYNVNNAQKNQEKIIMFRADNRTKNKQNLKTWKILK